MVNGNTWPFLTVEQRRYRFRFLNGCQSRFLILDFSDIPGVEVWQIGNEGGFLAAPVNLTADNGNRLLMGPGRTRRHDRRLHQRARSGNYVLGNVGPDEPFGGGEPGEDFEVADPATTGPGHAVPGRAGARRRPDHAAAVPAAARRSRRCRRATVTRHAGAHRGDVGGLRRRAGRGAARHRRRRRHGRTSTQMWTSRSPRTRPSATPRSGSSTTPRPTPTRCTSTRSTFEVVDRQAIVVQTRTSARRSQVRCQARRPRPPEPGRSGFKDTVIAYPGEVTRVRAHVRHAGPVRLALPHRRARGQRDDAAVPHRPVAAGPAGSDRDLASERGRQHRPRPEPVLRGHDKRV